MSENSWREINPHFRVDFNSTYTFAEVERWENDTRIFRESFFIASTTLTQGTMLRVYNRLSDYASEINELLGKPCGITITRMLKDADGFIVRIFQHDRQDGLNLVYRDPRLACIPDWLTGPLNEGVWDEVGSEKEAILGIRRLRSTPEEMGDIKPITLPEGYTEVPLDTVKPSVDLGHDAYRATMRALILRDQRAKTIIAELQVAEALDGLYTEEASKVAEAFRESARTWA